MASRGFFNAFDDVWLLDGVRTPMVDYNGALADASPTDMGIKVAREILARDERDASRADAPMRRADDADLLDTSDLSVDDAVQRAIALVEARLRR